MKWHNDSSNLDKIAVDAVNSKNLGAPECCSDPYVHVYAHKRSANRGSAWVWCSSCGAYSHFTFPISDEWENCTKIDFEKLTAVPEYLETMNTVVDEHLNNYLH